MSVEETVTRRIAEARVNKSTALYLSHCNLTTIPEEVFELEHLQHLDLKNNRLVYLPRDVSRLKELKGLYLNHNRLKELPDEITSLPHTQVLKLDGNRLKKLPESIDRLKELRYLYAGDNHLRELPPELFQLRRLKVLNLSNNRLETLPTEIQGLNRLEVLDLTHNRIIRLPAEISRLTSLQLLYLSRNRLSELALEMFQLNQLIRLDLNFNRLKTLPDDISLLMSLRVLNLEGNQLESLNPEVFQLENLNVLNLDGNRITELPQEIFLLEDLEFLSLSHNRLTRLPPEISRLKNLVYSGIDENPLEIPPIEIAHRGVPAIRHYFNQLKAQGEDCLYEADLIVVGESGTGKTTLVHKLQDPTRELNPVEPPTLGVHITPWHFPYSEDIEFRANIRDFSGQKHMRHVHCQFFTKRSLFVVVFDNQQEDTHCHYWLDLVEWLSGRNKPVVIVLNEKHGEKKQLPIALVEGFARLPGVFTINLADNTGLAELAKAICQELKDLPHVGKEPIPKKWVEFRYSLDSITEPHIGWSRFVQLCGQEGITEESDAIRIAEFFCDLGAVLHFPKEKILKNILILNPHLVTEAIYRVLADEMLEKAEGRLDVNQLKRIWDSSPFKEMGKVLLQLMTNLELCFEAGSSVYIVPALLPRESPGVSQLHSADIGRLLHFRYRYTFMPFGILGRLMVRMHQFIMGKMFWRSGVVLQMGEALVEIQENFYHRELRIRIAGKGRPEAFDLVRQEIKALHATIPALEPLEMIPCNCGQCANQLNPQFYPYELLKRYRSSGRYKIVCERSLEDVVIHGLLTAMIAPPSPQPTYHRIIPAVDQKIQRPRKRNKIFIAYVQTDRQWLDRMRTHLKEFEDEGFDLDIWDDEQLNSGRKWEREIARAAAEFKIALLLITTDFMAGDFIAKNELPPLLEAAEREGALVLPLILKPSRFLKNPHLSHFQPVNHPDKPLISLPESQQEEILVNLIETIDENIRDINPFLTHQ
jgi:Leucine-rich repeat (LRR) protein/GTPase SAR1 family protein